MREEISDDVPNPVKNTRHRQHQRSRSLDAFDNLDLLEAQRLFRQKYLQNRAKFETQGNDTADNVRPVNGWVVSKSRRFSTDEERSSSTVQESIASTKVKNNGDDTLKAPSLVREISTKYVTPVHKSMLETTVKEVPSKSLRNSLPLTAFSRSANSNVHLRRTMSAREGNLDGRNVSRISDIKPLQTRWAQRATPTDDHLKSTVHGLRKHSTSAKFEVTDSAVNGAETRQTKWTQRAVAVGDVSKTSDFQSAVNYLRKPSLPTTTDEVDSSVNRTGAHQIKSAYPAVGERDITNRLDFKSPLSYSRVYAYRTTGSETGETVSKTAENKLNNKSSLFIYLNRPTTSSVNTEAERNHWQDQHGTTVNSSTSLTATGRNKQSSSPFSLSTNTRKFDITNESPGSQNGAEISDSSGLFAAATRTPLAYSSFKTGMLNKTWKPVPVHRHNSFNDATMQEISKIRGYRSISRTKSDLDKYRTVPGTGNQSTSASDKPQSVRSTLPLVSPPSAKLVVKARDEILPSTASLKTQFRRFNPPTS
ncbi:uncharacterized protein LOC126188352 [Schistocerca cancellata]|uniref:uncharacterized protein LOC126188352 n=1 Tax=Schistocerca cancellata TaxID=274614 RepID=UPI002119991A|nr:uncharacterized protein LOC126188352 [Schistocerca cancellata]